MNSARSTLILALAFTFGCPAGAGRPPDGPPLFNDLGGIEGLRPMVDELTWRLVTDPLLAPTLATVDISALKEEILLFLCAQSGGPCLDAGDRPIISFGGSPSGAARVVTEHLRDASLATGARREVTERLAKVVASEVRALIGPPR